MTLNEHGRVAIGKVLSPYGYDSANPAPLRHLREVEWITKESIQNYFDAGIISVLNEDALIARVTHPAAERQVFSEIGKAIQKSTGREVVEESRAEVVPVVALDAHLDNPVAPIATQEGSFPREEFAAPAQDRVRVSLREEISSLPSAFDPREEREGPIRPEVWSALEGYVNRHGLMDLVRHIFESDGYQIGFVERADAHNALFNIARGRLGFESPRILVNLVDNLESFEAVSPERLKTLAVAQNVDAILVVGWHAPSAHVRSTLHREGLLLWTRDEVARQILGGYGTLPGTVQAEIGLRRIWTA
jgi:predicted Mrr-cat superfamily restriction endonuclease